MACIIDGKFKLFNSCSVGCQKSELPQDARTSAAALEGKEYYV